MRWFKGLKKKSTESQPTTVAPVVDTSTSATVIEPANDSLTKIDAIHNVGTLFEVLRSVSEASGLLSPLKAICGVLKIATDMAEVSKLLLFYQY
jgi:hypothetical protein